MNKRLITINEAERHGCYDCKEACRSAGIETDEHINGKYLRGKACPHKVCPYAKEMDKYSSYEDYVEAQNKIWGPMIGRIAFA